MHDDTVIPPVAAGTLSSSIELEHKHDINRDDTKRVTARHEWTFDSFAYNYHTGLHLGADYPYVPQENGHTLIVHRDCKYNPADAETDDDRWYRLSVEETWRTDARSGPTVHYSHYHIDVDKDGHIVDFDDEAFRYNGERNERYDPRRGGEIFEGSYAGDPMQLVRALHFGTQPFGESVDEQIRYLLEADSPDDAVPAAEYDNTDRIDERPASADD
jgi:hypothetical protein